MRKLSIIIISLLAAVTASAQTITFSSEAFEEGVKAHIGLDETASVTQNQTDTITALDLSRLGIDDIRDVAYLPAVEKLDLSCNQVTDLSPLLSLQSLKELNLSSNDLENIDVLAFTSVSEMVVNVSFNHISDFSFFFTPMACCFTFIGMDQQTAKDAPYLKVCELYSQINEEGLPMITYRGYTNSSEPVVLRCLEAQTAAIIDGQTHTVDAPGNPDVAAEVSISLGELEEKTYVVPCAYYSVEAGKSITMDTGLPEEYVISSAYAKAGTVEITGNTLKYTAPEDAAPDLIYFTYYLGSTLKGFSRFYINQGETEPIKIGSSGKATYTGSQPLDFSGFEDLKAYVATGYESDGTVWLTRIKQVPANTSIMIKGEAGKTYEVPVMDKCVAHYENMFKGSADEEITVSTTTADGKYRNFYMASGQFKPVSDKGQSIKAGKCYLQVPASFKKAVSGASPTVKIAESGKSSYAPPVDVDLTGVEGLKAYAATGYDAASQTIWLTRINKIQAGEGVMLKGEGNKTYTLPAAEVQAYYGNMIVGNIDSKITINETSDDEAWTNFYLASGSFKKVSGTREIGTNKSYLHLPTSLLVSSSRGKENAGIDEWLMEELETEFMLLGSIEGEGDDEDSTTRIDAIGNESAQPNDDTYYNLQGQRVNNPKKGLYIQNGKKVIIR